MTDLTRRTLVASSLAAAVSGVAPMEALAETASIRIKIVSAGFIIGAAGGNGSITFRGRTYRLGIGGVSVGATIGASGTDLIGTATNMRNIRDIEGVYTAAGAGLAVAGGAGAVQLSNGNGVVLRLKGRKIGFEFKLDLSGMSISLR
jgi:hypothetical protein